MPVVRVLNQLGATQLHVCVPLSFPSSATWYHRTAANHKHDRPLPNSEAAIWEMVKGDTILPIFNELSTRALGKYVASAEYSITAVALGLAQ